MRVNWTIPGKYLPSGLLTLFVLVQAPLQCCPGGRAQRRWVRPLASPDAAVGRVDVVQAQQPHFAAGGAMQQREQAGHER